MMVTQKLYVKGKVTKHSIHIQQNLYTKTLKSNTNSTKLKTVLFLRISLISVLFINSAIHVRINALDKV